MFIDPPDPFAAVEEWEEFLASMRSVKEPDEDVLRHIVIAEQIIAADKAAVQPSANGDW